MTADRGVVMYGLSAQSLPQVTKHRHAMPGTVGHLLTGIQEPAVKPGTDTTRPSASINLADDAVAQTRRYRAVADGTPVLQVRNPAGRVEIRIDDNAVVPTATLMPTITGVGSVLAYGPWVAGPGALPTSIGLLPAAIAHGCVHGADYAQRD